MNERNMDMKNPDIDNVHEAIYQPIQVYEYTLDNISVLW